MRCDQDDDGPGGRGFTSRRQRVSTLLDLRRHQKARIATVTHVACAERSWSSSNERKRNPLDAWRRGIADVDVPYLTYADPCRGIPGAAVARRTRAGTTARPRHARCGQ